MPAFHVVTGRHLSRRSFLRGTGVALSLPLLDAMTPALARAATAETPRRFVAICATLGFHTPFLFPNEAGENYTSTPYLDVLKEHRKDLTVLSGVSHPDQSGANGHTSELTWLTSARRPGLAGFKNTVSIDQLIAEKVGPQTRFPSLVLSSGANDSLSWTANGVPIPAENSPAKLFQQMFVNGNASEVKAQQRGLQRGRSILDTVAGEAKKLERTLGPQDRQKLDEYFTAVRGLEGRLRESEGWTNKPKPAVAAKPPTDIQNRSDAVGRFKLLADMVVLAFRTDSTRTVTIRLSGLGQVPVVDGVTHEWHGLSHHGQDPAKLEELKLIELAEFRALNDFLTSLKAIKENNANLLDRTAVIYGSNLGNSSSHDWRNLPLVFAGGGFKHGQHLAFDRKNNAHFSNLFVAVARRMGIELETFGSSTSTGLKGLEMVG